MQSPAVQTDMGIDPDRRLFVGVHVSSAELASEGIGRVLTQLLGAGVTAVSVDTAVSAPGRPGNGSLAPPSDGGASVRTFDRPLWGQQSLWLRHGPGHASMPHFYADSPYQPPKANDVTEAYGHLLGDFLIQAKRAGLKTYLQVVASTPQANSSLEPQLRPEDTPLLPDGKQPHQMIRTGSLASDAIKAWARALVGDLLATYPAIDGIRLDLVEYPCYRLSEVFQDFSVPACRWGVEHGLDVAGIRREVGDLYRVLHGGLTNSHLDQLAAPGEGYDPTSILLGTGNGIQEWLQWKSGIAAELLAVWKSAVDESSGGTVSVQANGFAPPFSGLTGFDYTNAAKVCEAVSPKMYTMHWPMMVTFWAQTLLAANPGLEEPLLVRALVQWFDLDEGGSDRLQDWRYPEPHESHPVSSASLGRKIAQVIRATGDNASVIPIVHGYGPSLDFARRLTAVVDGGAAGVWVNRYAYVSDEKFEALWRLCGSERTALGGSNAEAHRQKR